MPWKVAAHDQPHKGEVDVVVAVSPWPDDTRRFMLAPTFTAVDNQRTLPPNVVWSLESEDADAMLGAFAQAAWERGWRPKGFGTEDISTMRLHLEDKREEVRWLREQCNPPATEQRLIVGDGRPIINTSR